MENWGITEAFYRFKSIGSSDIDVDDLEKVLSHLSYLKIDPQAGALKTSTKKIHEFFDVDVLDVFGLQFPGSESIFQNIPHSVWLVFCVFSHSGSSHVSHFPLWKAITEIAQKLTKFATLDYEEYMRFIRASRKKMNVESNWLVAATYK